MNRQQFDHLIREFFRAFPDVRTYVQQNAVEPDATISGWFDAWQDLEADDVREVIDELRSGKIKLDCHARFPTPKSNAYLELAAYARRKRSDRAKKEPETTDSEPRWQWRDDPHMKAAMLIAERLWREARAKFTKRESQERYVRTHLVDWWETKEKTRESKQDEIPF